MTDFAVGSMVVVAGIVEVPFIELRRPTQLQRRAKSLGMECVLCGIDQTLPIFEILPLFAIGKTRDARFLMKKENEGSTIIARSKTSSSRVDTQRTRLLLRAIFLKEKRQTELVVNVTDDESNLS